MTTVPTPASAPAPATASAPAGLTAASPARLASGQHRVATAEPLVLVQVLRAVAALLVLAGHIQGQVIAAAAAAGVPLRPVPLLAGGFGVDLFFAISGFIMVVSSSRLFGTPGARATFLWRRACRLVPLYWIATLCYLPVLVWAANPYPGELLPALLKSLLFIPFAAPGTAAPTVFPLYTLGWSLNYEVFFYALFACFIVLPPGRAVAALGAALMVVVGAGWVLAPGAVPLVFWSQPIVLEFGLGAVIGLAWARGWRVNAAAAGALLATALAALLLDPLGLSVKVPGASTPNDWARLLGWGLPAALVVLAAVLFEQGRRIDLKRLSFMAALGDCSYSLYLMHPFALIALTKAWKLMHLNQAFGWPALALVLAAGAVALAWISYAWIEKPLTQRLQRLHRRGEPAARVLTNA